MKGFEAKSKPHEHSWDTCEFWEPHHPCPRSGTSQVPLWSILGLALEDAPREARARSFTLISPSRHPLELRSTPLTCVSSPQAARPLSESPMQARGTLWFVHIGVTMVGRLVTRLRTRFVARETIETHVGDHLVTPVRPRISSFNMVSLQFPPRTSPLASNHLRRPPRSLPLPSRPIQSHPRTSSHPKVPCSSFEKPRLQRRSLPLLPSSRVQEHQVVCSLFESMQVRASHPLAFERH
ncbi:hypothetical protein BKA83DRAFT_1625310 [Pisolithus microcarpus]|nr:hypothetical protein BKA83DRAFT_1625310 [Pisolithus microcarpus]